MTVSIVIINWNGGDVFRSCLTSLKKLKYKDYELIVVDNGSTDGTQELATIKNKENLGFANGNNQGYEKSHGKYIWLLNNDTLVKPDTLTTMVKYLDQNPKVAVIQPKIRIMDKPELLDNAGSFLTRSGFLEHRGYLQHDGQEYNQVRDIFSAKGACMLIRKAVIEKVGLFDPDFGSYFEETDFCWRVWLTGYKIRYYPLTEILHKVGYTSKRMDPVGTNYASFKNRLCSLIKNLEYKNFYVIIIHLILIKALAIYYLLRLQFDKSMMVWRAIWWNVVNLNNTLRKRNFVQKLRTKSDSEIFETILVPWNAKGMFTHFRRAEADF